MKKLIFALASIVLFALPTSPVRAQGNCGGGGPILQDCPPVNMPEPNTFVLLAAGLGALCVFCALREFRSSKVGGR
jgi:hypothetical protein